MNRARTILVGAGAALSALVLVGCGGGSDPLAGDSGGGSDSSSTITIGSANFPESELLMQMYAQALEAKGVQVETQPNIGAREIYMEAFNDGSINLLPEYNGALLAYLSPDGVSEDVSTPEEVYDALQEVLPEGAQTLEQSAAEDKDTLTVTQETAAEYNLQSLADLAPVAGEMSVGAGPEFQERFQGSIGLQEVYGVTFGEFKPLDAGGPLTIAALQDGDVDVANVFSTDSAIPSNGWVTLEDPENLFLAQNVVPLIKSEQATPEVVEALNGVSAALTTQNLTDALAQVQVDKADPVVVAGDFLTEHGLK
ncbi:ABC transporter substrate-binding protein [Naumannella halotolerans]|uniref:Osmoprotectant transport system substrate-binding protein n=1 Tax=Naumannella halotolerans TaxID=993414 RepID=A0A4R7J7Z5_9ACTN|nr:ABC transporter substrate-binding protein [Naumannella halotolerans]TDT32583.1 osmoprotectant transport system substrate-binding protein [Naumannella halotolerans]